jgi:serine/threonine protein phosphatase PrpC
MPEVSTYNFEIGEATRLGNRRLNQDRCIAVESDDAVLIGLADGMGGHPKGERAAEILTETCNSFFRQAQKPIVKPGQFLTRLLQKAHENVTSFGLQQSPSIDPRTTAVVVLIQKGIAYWAHVGDSRFYLFRDGVPVRRTVDHSYVERLRQFGVISDEERESHPHRNYVTRCLGGDITLPDISIGKPEQLQYNDTLLLCSDGLWAHIKDEDMGTALMHPRPISEILHNLTRQAEDSAYPDSDNVTAIGLRWQSSGGEVAVDSKAVMQKRAGASQDELNKAIEELKDAIEAFESKEEN